MSFNSGILPVSFGCNHSEFDVVFLKEPMKVLCAELSARIYY